MAENAARAVAILRKGNVFLQRYLPTTAGVTIAAGPVKIAAAEDETAISENLRDILSAPHRVLPHPTSSEWKSVQAPMLDAVGAKSWAALAKGSRAVGVELNGEIVTMEPSSDYEKQGGTTHPERSLAAALDEPRLGKVLLSAFAACG